MNHHIIHLYVIYYFILTILQLKKRTVCKVVYLDVTKGNLQKEPASIYKQM